MQLVSRLLQSLAKTAEHTIISLIYDSKTLIHILQIHAFLLKTSLQTNNFLIAKLLGKLSFNSSQNLLYARSLFDDMPTPDTFVWNTMIRAYLISQNYDECLSLFIRLYRQDHTLLDSFSLSLVVQACGRSGFLQNGQLIHTKVVKLGFHGDLFVQTGLIEMYAKFGLRGLAGKVLVEMKDSDLVSYNVLLAEYVRVGEIGFARELFDKMTERDLVSWNTLIHGYASLGKGFTRTLFYTCHEKDLGYWSCGGYEKSRQSHEALRLFNEMQLAKVLPDKITMVSVLSACGDLGALGMGEMAHKYIERNRIVIDIKLGTSLVDMYAKCGDIDSASRVFNAMSKRDVFSWTAMIMGFANHGYGEVALDHFNMMKSERINPNDITFIGVLSACSHIGLVTKGWNYFNSMSDAYGLTPKIEHYGCMVDIFSRSGHLDEARELIRNMPFVPDAIVWRALLGACKIYKNVELAEEAAMKILSLDGHANGNSVLLSNIYSQAKKWDEVVNIRRMMKHVKVQKLPGSSSIEVNNAVHEFVAGDRSHPRSKDIYLMLAKFNTRLKHRGDES